MGMKSLGKKSLGKQSSGTTGQTGLVGLVKQSVCGVLIAGLAIWILPLQMTEAGHQEHQRPDELVANAPDFSSTVLQAPLINQFGERFRLDDFEGRTVLLNFIFTGCSTVCPMQTVELQQVQSQLASHPASKDITFVSVSITPEADTPGDLAMFAKRHQVDQSNWFFATGESEAITAMGDALWVGVKPGTNDQFDHRTLLYLIGPQGLLLQRYNGEPVDVDRVVSELVAVDEVFGSPL